MFIYRLLYPLCLVSHFASGVSSLILFLLILRFYLLSVTNPSKGEDNFEVLVMIQMCMEVSHNECISVEVLVSINHSLLTSDL